MFRGNLKNASAKCKMQKVHCLGNLKRAKLKNLREENKHNSKRIISSQGLEDQPNNDPKATPDSQRLEKSVHSDLEQENQIPNISKDQMDEQPTKKKRIWIKKANI